MTYTRGNLFSFFAEDHDRIEDLLEKATHGKTPVDPWFYDRFRSDLLLHISMEDEILLPAAERMGSNEKLGFARKIRLEHRAIAALLVPKPIPLVLNALRAILAKHNEAEEQAGGMYDVCEQLTQQEVDHLLMLLQQTPDTSPNPLQEPSLVLDETRRALKQAGYDLDQFASESPSHAANPDQE